MKSLDQLLGWFWLIAIGVDVFVADIHWITATALFLVGGYLLDNKTRNRGTNPPTLRMAPRTPSARGQSNSQ